MNSIKNLLASSILVILLILTKAIDETAEKCYYTNMFLFKATPHDPRLTPLHIICLPAFRHDYQRHQR